MALGEGMASCPLPVPPGLLSAQALGPSRPPPSCCRTPGPICGLKNEKKKRITDKVEEKIKSLKVEKKKKKGRP